MQFKKNEGLDVDLLIVGSGPAASVYAAKASVAGKKVIMLEAGPERSMNGLISSQIWARKLKWGGSPVEESGNHKIGFNFNSGWGTGGTGMHHYGVWPRLHECDLKQRTLFGVGNDWPIDYHQLQPYYDQIQQEIGISGDEQLEKWRPEGRPYPMPPVPVFSQGRVIAKGFKEKGMHTAPIPLAINTQPRGQRASCIYDGWCDAGCPTGALANPLTHYLPQASKAGAKIIHQATATRVLTDQKGEKVTGVEYYSETGEKHIIRTSVLVLAGGAVQNARLLLASANSDHSQGLSNRNDLVGRYLMTHPSKTVNGLFEDQTEPHLGVTGGQLINQDNYDDKLAIKDAFGGYQWLIANAVKPNDLLGFANSRPDIRGNRLAVYMQKAAKHFGTMVYVADDLPLAENRVSLSKKTDQFGMPLAHATHTIRAETNALISHADAQGLDVFEKAGAEEAWLGPLAGMHIMGGTIMGKSSEDSVTNPYGQTHEIDNLFIAGSGLFPSSGAVNPTFTLHALALSGVEYMLREWSGLA
jgi:choline dehydrogenase-like flavoprotein